MNAAATERGYRRVAGRRIADAAAHVSNPALRSEPAPLPSPAGRWEEYRLGARILLRLARLPRGTPGSTAHEGRTQDGLAAALGVSRTSVGQTLQALEDGGAVRAARAHAERHRRRVKVYELTPEGERIAARILESLGASPRPRPVGWRCRRRTAEVDS